MSEGLISESETLIEFDKRLSGYRHGLLGRCPADASDNSHQIAWCDGAQFGREQAIRIYENQKGENKQ